MPSFSVRSYTVDLTNCATPYAYIMLYNTPIAEQAMYRVRLNFSQLQEVNDYTLTQEGDFINVAMNFKNLQPIIDLLRNERPVFFHWSTETDVAILATHEEPVGEGQEEPVTGNSWQLFPKEYQPLPKDTKRKKKAVPV